MTENNVRHRIFFRVPKCLPPFDSAIVNLDKKGMLKLLLNAAPKSCTILTFSSHVTPLAKYFNALHKKNFVCASFSLEFSNDLCFTGRMIHLFVRRKEWNELSNVFYKGDSFLHERNAIAGNTIDLYCGGQKFHDILKEVDRGKSLVFSEEQ